MLGINDVLAVHEPNPLVHPTRADLRLEAQVETASARLGFQRPKLPAGIGGLAVNRVLFRAKRGGIAAEGQAEEITAQHLDDRRLRTDPGASSAHGATE